MSLRVSIFKVLFAAIRSTLKNQEEDAGSLVILLRKGCPAAAGPKDKITAPILWPGVNLWRGSNISARQSANANASLGH